VKNIFPVNVLLVTSREMLWVNKQFRLLSLNDPDGFRGHRVGETIVMEHDVV